MTRRSALAQARREISPVFRTAANANTVTWGVRVTLSHGTTITEIGSYRNAASGRREWIAERAKALCDG